MHIDDVRDGLKRVRTLLNKLNEHEGSASVTDDRSEVMTVRFAFLDAARREVDELINESEEGC